MFKTISLLFFALAFILPLHAQQLEFHEVGDKVWRVVSYSNYQGIQYPSNSLIVENNDSLILVDTSWGSENTKNMLFKIRKEFNKPIAGAIITHSHEDKAGGLVEFQSSKINTFGFYRTWSKLLKEEGIELDSVLYKNTSKLKIAGLEAWVYFPGEGHSDDNSLVFFPEKNMLYGGCFVKDRSTDNLGNLADANPKKWRKSLIKTIFRFRAPIRKNMLTIPGHGKPDAGLLMHTLKTANEHLRAKRNENKI